MTDPQFSTITMVLPRVREGLRRVGAPMPDDHVLGFSAAPPAAA